MPHRPAPAAPASSANRTPASGSTYLHMPYVVKGMDVSFSGLCSFVDELYSCARRRPPSHSACPER